MEIITGRGGEVFGIEQLIVRGWYVGYVGAQGDDEAS